MSGTPVFTNRTAGEPVYWLDVAVEGRASSAAGACAGVVFRREDAASLGPSVDLTRSRGLDPIYFFARTAPTTDPAAFAAALRALAPPAPDERARFVWLENADAPAASWRGAMAVAGSDGLTGQSDLGLAGHALRLAAATPLSWSDKAAEFGAGASFGWQDRGRPGVVALERLTLDFTGPKAGILRGAATLDGAALKALGLACRRRLDEAVLAFPIFDQDARIEAAAEFDPLFPIEGERTRLVLTSSTAQPTAFRCLPWPSRLTLRPEGRALIVLTGGGLALDGAFALDTDTVQPTSPIDLICGQFSGERLSLSRPAAFVLSPSAERGVHIGIRSDRPAYAVQGRGRNAKPVHQALPAWLPEYPLLPYALTEAPAAAAEQLETGLMIPAREAVAAAAAPPPLVEPEPVLPVILVGKAPPPLSKAQPPKGWTLPGTRDEETIGTAAIFTDEESGLSLQLSGLPPAFVRALAFPPARLLMIEDGSLLAEAQALIKLKDETILLDPGFWAANGVFLVIRAGGGADDPLAAAKSPPAWPPADWEPSPQVLLAAATAACAGAPAPVREAFLALLAGGHGIALTGASGAMPARAAKMADGLIERLGQVAPPRWFLALPAGDKPAGRLASVMVVDLPSQLEDASEATLASAHLWPQAGGGWRARLHLRIERLLGHVFPDSAAIAFDIAAAPAGETMTLEGAVEGEGALLKSVRLNLGQRLQPAPAAASAAKPDPAKPAIKWALHHDLEGWLNLRTLPMDLLSFGDAEGAQGGLPFTGLTLGFEDRDDGLALIFDDRKLSIDGDAAVARKGSFYDRFPLSPPELLRDREGKPFSALGYAGVACEGATASPSQGWCALRHQLDLGTLGRMGAGAGLAAELVIAWQPDPAEPNVAVGLRFPGLVKGGRELSLAGLIRLEYRALSLRRTPAKEFVLRLEDIKLSMLGAGGFPPGRTDLLLFGNPNGRAAIPSFGWFAAYDKGGTGKNAVT